MAGLAVGVASVVEGDLIPTAGRMAIRAVSRPMTGGRGMACFTVIGWRMYINDRPPTGGRVAVQADTRIMAGGFGMTGQAVGISGVVKACGDPGGGGVTVDAFAAIMCGGCCMALRAGIDPDMLIVDRMPGLYHVAARADVRVMPRRRLVTVGTCADGVKGDIQSPPGGDVTIVTLPVVMIGWGSMAGGAVGSGIVLEQDYRPIGG